MSRPAARTGATTALLLMCAGAAALSAASLTPAQIKAADAEIARRLAGCSTPVECAERTARIALLDKPGPVRDIAHARTVEEVRLAKYGLFQLFREGKPEVQAAVFRVFTEGWSYLGGGVDGSFTGLAQDGLDSPHPAVKRAAAEFASGHRLIGITHWIIDAAEDDRSLTLAALQAIENLGDPVATRWVIGQLTHRSPVIRDAAQRALWKIGRAGLDRLNERLDVPDAAVRQGVMEAYLLIAVPDDIPRLQAWLEAHESENANLSKKVTAAIGQLEAGHYNPAPPARPPVSFDVK